jgi:predicted deacylase
MAVIFEMESPFRTPYQLHRLEFGLGEGPTVAFVAGIHGNELNGIHALNMLISVLHMQKIRGRILMFPLVNTFGADECTKRFPFDKNDINGAFPGDSAGYPAERIAAALYEATAEADICIDVHSGAAHVRELPQVRAPLSGAALEYARAMRLPVIWKRSGEYLSQRGLVASWRKRGQVALHVIGGRGVTLDNSLCAMMASGFSSLLAHLNITMGSLDTNTSAEVTQLEIELHRAACGGFFVPEVRVGERVQVGRLLGYLQSPIGGERISEVRAKKEGIVMTLRANPLVHAQELLVRIASTRHM